MAEEKKTISKRNKPKFLRTDWHKKIKLGRGVKKNQKWHGAKGRQNKFRLCRKGRGQRPKVGWGSDLSVRDKVLGLEVVRIANLKELLAVEKGFGIIIGSVGKKKRLELIKKAQELNLKVVNRYLKEDKKYAIS